jgi:hypothetical protein
MCSIWLRFGLTGNSVFTLRFLYLLLSIWWDIGDIFLSFVLSFVHTYGICEIYRSLFLFISQQKLGVYVLWSTSLMKQQFVVTYQYTVLQETEKTWQIFNIPTYKHIMFLQKYKEKQFLCGHKILTGVFVTQLSSNVGISVRRIMWVTTNCCFMSNINFNIVGVGTLWTWTS